MLEVRVKITRTENAAYFGCSVGDIIPIDFEWYIGGVAASEIGNVHIEACKAQAVAARTFAMSRGVLRGQTISDSSADAQAFRAVRCDKNKYPNALLAAEQTAGQILLYDGEPARTVYTSANGGRVVSSEERWGGSFSYLVSREDPWDKAAGYPLKGHGVGMSQRGAAYAASTGINYEEILQFYYPGTVLVPNYGELPVNEKAQMIIQLAKSRLGCEYVFGAVGQYRNGSQIFDCRGFTYWLLKQVGISISTVGATTQYNAVSDWTERGLIKDLPNLVCPVFKYRTSDGRMSHTGMHLGDGVLIHCTSNGGVKYGNLSDSTWTHYAVPRGLYTPEEIEIAREHKIMRTLKTGSSGSDVKGLQEILMSLGYDCGMPDGVFGSKTKSAVEKFQSDHGLSPDGIVGPLTWATLTPKEGISDAEEEDPEEETVPLPRAQAFELYLALREIFGE